MPLLKVSGWTILPPYYYSGVRCLKRSDAVRPPETSYSVLPPRLDTLAIRLNLRIEESMCDRERLRRDDRSRMRSM